MGWYSMLYRYRNGDEPPACTIGNDRAHDLAAKAESLGHVDRSQLWNADAMSIDRKFVISKVEAQSVPFLAFEPREATFLPILAWMLELGECPLFLHTAVALKSLLKMTEFLLRSAFGDLIAPRELFFLDLVIFALEVLHLGPLALGSVLFPTS